MVTLCCIRNENFSHEMRNSTTLILLQNESELHQAKHIKSQAVCVTFGGA